MSSREQQIAALEQDWKNNPRWTGIKRNYTAEDVVRLRGSLQLSILLLKLAQLNYGIWLTMNRSSMLLVR